MLMEDVKKSTKARVLVVVPSLGRRLDLLRQTLFSVAKQGPIPYDIVMVYPLKNREAARIAEEFGALSIDDPGSLSGALNAGIAQAKSHHEFLSWIGDDDLLAPSSFATCIHALDTHPDAVIAFGYCDYIDSRGKCLFTSRAGRLAPWLMTWGPNLVPCPGTLFRLSALKKAGEFDIANTYSMDLDMLLRLRKIGPFVNTKSVLASFRWHTNSTTVANRDNVLREAEQVKRKHLPKHLRAIAPLWEQPVRIATKFAARRVNQKAS